MSFFKALFNAKQVLNEFEENGELLEISGELRMQLQRVLLSIVEDIQEACQRNHISFFLCHGSAIGAIRHKGFIPWDDDFDIAMSREDYEKFKNVFEKELSEKYELNAPNLSDQVIARFPKVLLKDSCFITTDTQIPELQKIYVDIFIMDNIPKNKIIRFFKGTYCNLLEYIGGQVQMVSSMDDYIEKAYKRTNITAYVIKKCIGKMFSFKSVSEWNNRIDKAVQYPYNTGFVGFPTGRKHYFGEIFKTDELLPQKTLMCEFNGAYLPILEKTDIYLRRLYGDYMHIPSENKRERHFVKAIDFGIKYKRA